MAASESAAVLRADAGRLYLHFLEVFKDGVFSRLSFENAVDVHTIDEECIFRAARAVYLDSAFDIALIDSGRCDRQALETARFRYPIQFLLGEVVRHERALRVD